MTALALPVLLLLLMLVLQQVERLLDGASADSPDVQMAPAPSPPDPLGAP